jgi:4-hydroxy-tetrahydrodipicolinate reductase
MNIAIIGYGKMGKIVEQIALSQGFAVCAIVDPSISITPYGQKIFKTINEADLNSVDVAIEFTQPDTAVKNIIALTERKIKTVTGTTGWFESLDEVGKAVKKAGTSLFWASNFSIGVNMFNRIAWYAAQLVNNFPEYDVGGFESHHNKKMDSPSGTANTLMQGVLSRIDRKKKIVWETMKGKIEPEELHFPSLRMGCVPGTHSLFFDSPADTIEITHTARNREGFASGALRAAQWLVSHKQNGVFTIDDMMNELFKESL